MPRFRTALLVEYRKLSRSLAAVLVVVAPALVAAFLFCNLLRVGRAQPWDMWMMKAAAIWAFFMLPMSVTALTLLVAQVEHGPRTWSHLYALPVPRWHYGAAKIAWICAAVALMTGAAAVGSWLALHAAVALKPSAAPPQALHVARIAMLFASIYASSLLLIAVQLWLALRWHSFVPALAVGIGGTFFAVVASGAKIGMVLPWQIPVNMLAAPPRAHASLLLGSVGGLLVLAWLLIRFSRREVQ
ncbi:MAG TPA: ABC transporter permease [Rhodanobacteraceae bacterium]|nr:ABC transporter permease [Rhodanobacteraceae bacterium]